HALIRCLPTPSLLPYTTLFRSKTLVSTLPVYLNALTGKGVHVITVNEYLAQRDAKEMGEIHHFLGLTVGINLNGMTQTEKQHARSEEHTSELQSRETLVCRLLL